MADTNTRILVTGGAGFIGSALVRLLIAESDYAVLNDLQVARKIIMIKDEAIDALTRRGSD